MKQIFLAFMALTTFSCSKPTTEVEPIYDFALYTEQVSYTINEGQTIEIACELHKSYFYSEDARFTISYTQPKGAGTLTMNGERLRAERAYTLPKGEFTMSYTAQGENHHELEISVSDQFSNIEQSNLYFTNN